MAVVFFIFAVCLGGLMYLLPTAISLRNIRRHAATKTSVPAGYPREKDIAANYCDVFPPSRAHIISPPSTIQATSTSSNLASSATQLLKISDNYRTADPSAYIFSGFTVAQVRALGCFPDYAKLSGVPLPSPLKDFRIENATPRPYRPFRWPYHQTMSFQKMDPNYWLELESTYPERIAQRQALVSKNGDDVRRCMPGSELACKELMEMAIQFLCARYPSQFEVDGEGILTNRILNTQHNLGEEAPLDVIVNNVPEDFGIMLRDESTGRYHFRAGVICSSLGWNLGEKIGRGLGAIHRPVPKYREKMEFSVDRFFTKLPAENPVQRGSWSLEVGQPLYMPSDDPHMRFREYQDSTIGSEDVFLRVDWQTLRRLPVSGAIVFNFKALFTPIAAFEKEPYIPSLLYKVISDADESLLKYKGSWHVEHVAKPALKKFVQTQIDQGLVEEDWEPRTLDESPFYPGWQSGIISS